MTDFPLCALSWPTGHRIVPSRFPTRTLFDRVADPADLEAAYAVESLTNDRLRNEVGNIALVPAEQRMTGPGTTPIMAAFTHLNPNGSRFSDGSFGVFYVGRDQATAVRETVYHRERFLAESSQPPIMIEMREYLVEVDGELRDLRSGSAAANALLDPADYTASQAFGVAELARGSDGIVYPSVRDQHGECAGVFRPTVLSPATQGQHFGYIWDGNEITDVVTLGSSGIAPHG